MLGSDVIGEDTLRLCSTYSSLCLHLASAFFLALRIVNLARIKMPSRVLTNTGNYDILSPARRYWEVRVTFHIHQFIYKCPHKYQPGNHRKIRVYIKKNHRYNKPFARLNPGMESTLLHALMNDLILFPLLRRLRKCVFRFANSASQGLEDVALADPGEDEIGDAEGE
jgi:hypothetical protein